MTDTFSSASVPSAGAQPGQPADDVTSALGELERKLRELERELTSIGRRRVRPEDATGVLSPGVQPTGEAPPAAGDPPPAAPAPAPRAATATPPGGAMGRLIDERVEPQPPIEQASVEWATPAERATPVDELRATAEPISPSDAQLASLAELRRFRDRVERFARELTDDYDAMLGRVMAGLSGRGLTEQPLGAEDSFPSAGAALPGAGQRAATPPSPPAPARPEEALFEGRVELGVGPFYDIASLGAFEQSLASIPSVSEVAVRRFEASHAVVDLRLATPVALVSELRRALQAGFSVRQVAEGRMLLTFDDA